ncbi:MULTISPECIES: hypothetical protein [Nocardiopsis]|uniref:hypothetical protein n=1 Tax=Nocardiopsis TaxID=2013 RepID=UPI00117F6E4A|nr:MULTISPECIES: hypothetical protein [Nocardiopsis]
MQDFEREVLEDVGIPTWFACLTDDASAGGAFPEEAREGVRGYFEDRGGEEWDLQEWLFMFDPDLRSWSWWDVAGHGDGRIFLYIDTKGEMPVPCEELWWAVFASGAQAVDGPFLVPSEQWEEKPSIGTVPAE